MSCINSVRLHRSSVSFSRSLLSVALLTAGLGSLAGEPRAAAQPAAPTQTPAPVGGVKAPDREPVPAPLAGADTSEKEWCGVPLCREAEALRRAGDLQGALKLYRYINDEIDVDESVVKKPLLWFAIASLHGALQQPEPGLAALRKYQDYVSLHADAELPGGQRRADVERLASELRMQMGRLRIISSIANLRVAVDGKPAGVTPLAAPLPVLPGHHRIELSGDKTETQEVDVASGQEVLIWPVQPLGAASQPSATASDTARGGRPAWRIAVGVLGIGAGVAMIGAGAGALASDGTCISTGVKGPCPVEDNGNSQPVRRVVDGTPAGAGLIAAGIVASAVGTVLIALPGPRAAKQQPVHAAISFQNGASLTLGTSF